MKIEISEIEVNPGRREADLTGINELARSISEVGLLNIRGTVGAPQRNL